MSKTIICGECGEAAQTLQDCVLHYLAGCNTEGPCTLEEAIGYVADDIDRFLLHGEARDAFSNMLMEWWICQDDPKYKGFARGIAFCFSELGYEVDDE